MSSLYLHIPFCLSKCLYCSFSSFPGLERLYQEYCAALCSDIKNSYRDQHGTPLHTLFIGGGTPTVLDTQQLVSIITACRETYGFTGDAEISIEANPGTVTGADLEYLRSAGYNRLSIGIQSCHDSDLTALGRSHTFSEGRAAFEGAREAGFTNISLDLMCGLPQQTPRDWRESLERALSMQPEHLSIYQLTLEEGTAFHHSFQKDQLSLPEEDAVLEMDDITADLCTRNGFLQYEISNFSRPGYQCRHNIVYWNNEDYLACGAGAVSYLRSKRSRRIADPHLYRSLIEEGRSVIEESEKLDEQAAFRETVVMGLRLLSGVPEQRLASRFGGLSYRDLYGDTITRLIDEGLLEPDTSCLKLTRKGRRFANVVMAELV